HYDAGGRDRQAADELERVPGAAGGGQGREDPAAGARVAPERPRVRTRYSSGRRACPRSGPAVNFNIKLNIVGDEPTWKACPCSNSAATRRGSSGKCVRGSG